jgi:hypothetical protein
MSRSWNGKALLDEFTALLGDTSSMFRSRCLGWMNDVVFDIATRHDWGHHLVKGKKELAYGVETHSLELARPFAPTVELMEGGSLTTNSSYRVLVTFVQENGAESVAGIATEALMPTGSTLSIKLYDVAVSEESLVNERRIYLSKDGGKYYLATSLHDNFANEAEITANTTSTIEPPDYGPIRKLKGSPFFEQGQKNRLEHRDIEQLRMLMEGNFATGNPQYFAPITQSSLVAYPIPNEDMELSFNYYRYPYRIYDAEDSIPDLPINLKPALKAGIIAMGYEYRDRAGQEMKKANYENALLDAINRGGRMANIEYTVRDVYGNLNGFEVG